jgi:hypothetical protein
MVEYNGGPQTLGLNGFLEHLVCKFVRDVEVLHLVKLPRNLTE